MRIDVHAHYWTDDYAILEGNASALFGITTSAGGAT